MGAEEDVREARNIRLDPERQDLARARAMAALEVAAHHDRAARAARASADVLARTWQLDLDELVSELTLTDSD